MFKNIVVGVDGSENGRDAIALGRQLAGPETRLTLANVYAGPVQPVEAIAGNLYEAEQKASQGLLARELEEAGGQAEVASIFAAGPARGLHEWAEEHDADLIVVGTSHRGALGRVMLGDESRGALNGAPCAVAIASRGYGGPSRSIERIGVAYNETPEARQALEVAGRLAGEAGAALEALQVVSIPSVAFAGMAAPGLGESIDAMLDEAKQGMAKLAGVHGEAVYGLSGEELAAFSARVDLLVVGSRGYGPLRRLVLGSTSNYLARHARCPLLVLPRGEG